MANTLHIYKKIEKLWDKYLLTSPGKNALLNLINESEIAE